MWLRETSVFLFLRPPVKVQEHVVRIIYVATPSHLREREGVATQKRKNVRWPSSAISFKLRFQASLLQALFQASFQALLQVLFQASF